MLIVEGKLMLTKQDFLTGISYLKLLLNDAKLNGSGVFSPLIMYPSENGKVKLINPLFSCLIGFRAPCKTLLQFFTLKLKCNSPFICFLE